LEISRSRGGNDEGRRSLGCDAVWFRTDVKIVRRSRVPPPSGHMMVKLYQTTDQIRMLSVKPKYI
jgi:hypothetical protein